MKLSEFILLDESEKKWSVMHQGVLIAKRTYHSTLVFLFQLENYYVETYCNVSSKAIEEYRVLPNVQALHPYLENIPIDDLVK